MTLQLQNRWREDTHHYVRWSVGCREVIRLYKPRLQQQLVLSPRCGHLKGNGGVKAAVRFAQRLTNQYAYVARFDIRHYYESIDHRVMLAQCRHVSRDVFEVVQDYLCVPDRRRTGKGMVAGFGGKDQPAAPAAPPCALSQSAKVVPSANFHAVRPLMLAPTTIAAAAVTDLKM